ncbi:MAG: hypothetical protein KGQ37_03935 [Hyphomicrobiales bacterium]|nr:hypothetical protein [Hyphomicrobiales bacterium]
MKMSWPSPTTLHRWLNPLGRLQRLDYLDLEIRCFSVLALALGFSLLVTDWLWALLWPVMGIAAWAALCGLIKRLHDSGIARGWVLVPLLATPVGATWLAFWIDDHSSYVLMHVWHYSAEHAAHPGLRLLWLIFDSDIGGVLAAWFVLVLLAALPPSRAGARAGGA